MGTRYKLSNTYKKFIDIEITIPSEKIVKGSLIKHNKIYITELVKLNANLVQIFDEFEFISIFSTLSDILSFSFRQIEKAFTYFYLYSISKNNNVKSNDYISILFAVILVKDHELYNKLIYNKILFYDLISELNLLNHFIKHINFTSNNDADSTDLLYHTLKYIAHTMDFNSAEFLSKIRGASDNKFGINKSGPEISIGPGNICRPDYLLSYSEKISIFL